MICPPLFICQMASFVPDVPYCPHRGRASCEARPTMEPAPDTDQAEYVRRFAEYVGLYAGQGSRIEDFFWPLGMTCN